jgi:hypothetical protein
MKQLTKIQLLPGELELVSSTDFILTKNAILQKMKTFLEELHVEQQEIIKRYAAKLPQEVLLTSPKISRGENYKGLPWLVLDYPRHFVQHDIFAIRTLFWWGKFFSTTLHLSGRYKKSFYKKIIDHKITLGKNHCFISTGGHEWEHDVAADNYQSIKSYNKKELEKTITKNPFLKLAITFPFELPAAMENMLCRSYELLLKVCT